MKGFEAGGREGGGDDDEWNNKCVGVDLPLENGRGGGRVDAGVRGYHVTASVPPLNPLDNATIQRQVKC